MQYWPTGLLERAESPFSRPGRLCFAGPVFFVPGRFIFAGPAFFYRPGSFSPGRFSICRAGFFFCRAGFFWPGRLLPDRLAQTGPVVKSRGFKAHPGFWPAKPALCTALVRSTWPNMSNSVTATSSAFRFDRRYSKSH